MSLTRTKMLAAVALAGLLTTSAGVLSRAGAQAPPGPPAEDAVRQYRDALRGRVVPNDLWEYKFIPVDRPLTPADLNKVLAGADQDGWAYCGSQDLAGERTGKVTPHMVFRRPAAGGAAGARVDAAAAFLAELMAREAAARDGAAADGHGRRAEAENARKKADEKAAAESAAIVRDLEAAVARQQQAAKEAARLKAREAEREAADKARDREMAEMRALIEQLRAELKAKEKALELPARPGPEKK